MPRIEREGCRRAVERLKERGVPDSGNGGAEREDKSRTLTPRFYISPIRWGDMGFAWTSGYLPRPAS